MQLASGMPEAEYLVECIIWPLMALMGLAGALANLAVFLIIR